MKKLFYSIFLVMFTTQGFSQEGVWVETTLADLVKEFVKDAEDRGHDVVPILSNMKLIGFGESVKYPLLGYVTEKRDILLINEACKFDHLMLRTVLYHELGHAVLKLEHCDDCDENEIMNSKSPNTFSVYSDPKKWRKYVDNLFNM